jgi:hypothetical protein
VISEHPHYRDHVAPVARLVDLPADVAIVAGYGDLVRARREGYKRFVRMEHGIGQSYGTSHPHYAGGAKHDDVGLFLAPNEHSANRWRKAYPRARVEVVGSPRLDTLRAKFTEDDPPTVAISFHYDLYLVPETRSSLPWFAPALPALAKEFHVIGHSHPRENLAYTYKRLGIEYVRDFDEVCRRADVYVCDNSSTLYEFASTGRPVVVLNPPWYDRSKDYGLRFWEASWVGLQCSLPDELSAVVRVSLQLGGATAHLPQDALGIVYAYRTGAAQRAADAINDWLSE